MVLGISFDSPAENAAFAKKQHFPFPLLSDEHRTLAMAFGAADRRDAKYARRISVLIDERGRVARIYRKVKPATHAAEVLRDLAGAVR